MTHVISRSRAEKRSTVLAQATGIVFEALEPRNMMNADIPDADTVFAQGFEFWDGNRQMIDYYEGDKHALPDGKFLAIGTRVVDGNGAFTVFRLNPDGTRDQTFGIDGGVSYRLTPEGWQFHGFAMHGHTDGSILIAGQASGYNDGAGPFVTELAVARLHPDGSLDTTFGNGGYARTRIAREYYPRGEAITVQSDGKVVVAGSSYGPDVLVDSDFVVARFNTDGSLDAGFGDGGIVFTDYGDLADSQDRARAVAVADDGAIVVAGITQQFSLAVARLNADGSPDTTFGGGDGTLAASFGRHVKAHITAEESEYITGGFRAVVQFDLNGNFDATFGHQGIARAPATVGHDLLIDDQGRVVLAADLGWERERNTGRYFGFFGMNPDGRPSGLAAALPGIEAAYAPPEPDGGDLTPDVPDTEPIPFNTFGSVGNDRLFAGSDSDSPGFTTIGEMGEDEADDDELIVI